MDAELIVREFVSENDTYDNGRGKQVGKQLKKRGGERGGDAMIRKNFVGMVGITISERMFFFSC